MNKLDSLRAVLTQALPELARDPERLRIWVDTGRIRCPMTPSRDFSYEYTLALELVDFTGHPALVFLTINDWLRINQPDLAQVSGDSGYRFEVAPIDATTINLTVELDLTERAVLTPRAGGGWEISHPAEPAMLFADDLPLSEPVTALGEVWVGGVRIAPPSPGTG